MKTNFDFLGRYWPALSQIGGTAESYLYSDPNACIYKLGMFGERLVAEIFAFENLPLPQYDDSLANRIKVLKYEGLAIRGKLVPQDPNDEPASVLLDRIRAEKQRLVKEGKLKAKDIKNDTIIFVRDDNLHYEKLADGSVKCIEDEIPFDLADGWVWTRFSSIADISLGKMLDAAKNKGDAQKYLRNVNVRWGAFDLSDVLEMRFEEDEFDRFSIVRGDLVVCEGGEPGRCAIWDSDEAIFYQKALHRVRPISVLSEFIYYVLRAFIGAGIYDRYYTGITIKHLTGQSIKMLPIPLPPLNEQRRLTEQLDKMQLYIDAIESDKSDVITLIAQTKSQILDLAIRGQLVPQDSADEPASVLLERIREEKEELIKQGKTKRDKKESVIFRGDDNSYYRRSSDGKEEIVDDLPYAIPDSWEWTTIGELFAINPRNKIADDMDVSFIPMPLIDDGYSGYHRSETKQWKEVKTGFTHFQNGDIGLAKITPCFENRKSVIFRDLCNGFGAGTTELHVLRRSLKLFYQNMLWHY